MQPRYSLVDEDRLTQAGLFVELSVTECWYVARANEIFVFQTQRALFSGSHVVESRCLRRHEAIYRND